MKTIFYKLECLTNLHVGTSDDNYNLVDSEVEKDPVTGYPIIHASTIKGAVRRHLSHLDADAIRQIFGAPAGGNGEAGGQYHFLDGLLLARPLRVAGSEALASILTVTTASANSYFSRLRLFGCERYPMERVPAPAFDGKAFLTTHAGHLSVEGEPTGALDPQEPIAVLQDVLGENMAVAATFDGYDLPIVARIAVSWRGNLWFEEMVPAGSVFFFGIITEDELEPLPLDETVIQIGGNASIGCGYCRCRRLSV